MGMIGRLCQKRGRIFQDKMNNPMPNPVQNNLFFVKPICPDAVSRIIRMGNCARGKVMRSCSTHCLRKMTVMHKHAMNSAKKKVNHQKSGTAQA